MPLDIIAFDADDTLWVNEPHYTAALEKLCTLLAPFADADHVRQALTEADIHNLQFYGYGIKAYTLTMLETASRIANAQLTGEIVDAILAEGKRMFAEPIVVYDHVIETLQQLSRRKPLMLITRGELFEQENRIQRSGLTKYFNYIEIVKTKSVEVYRQVLDKYAIEPPRFVMIGNSLKSDILPVVALGGRAVYIPIDNPWQHDIVKNPDWTSFDRLDHIGLLPDLLEAYLDEA
ncbi:MAG: HAD family hydrolase [Anaerolineales bacterium]|nr:HAD family hydrolase [Anaerolineales bacterium]